jgi:hypothetical protein
MPLPKFVDHAVSSSVRLFHQAQLNSAGIAPGWLVACALVVGACLRLPIAVPQYATEGSLVLAGIVQYPSSSLMNYYFLGSWTSLHQLGALSLLAGVSQTIIDYLFCILPAGLLLSAMTMLIHGFCGRPIFSLVAALICFSTTTVASNFASTDYPLLGATWASSREHTFGIWGAVGAAWVFGALGGGRNTTAGFSAAALISIHPVIGLYTFGIMIVVVTVGYLFPNAFSTAGVGRGLLAGSAVTVISLAWYLAARPPVPSDIDTDAFATYLKVWDYHRSSKIDYGSVRALIAPPLALAFLIVFFLLASRGRRGTADVGAMALFLTISGSVLLFAAAHLGSPPQFFVNAIPGRFLNIHAYLSGAIILALATWFFTRLLVMTLAELSLLIPGGLSEKYFPPGPVLTAAIYGLFALILAVRVGVWVPLEQFAANLRQFVVAGHAPRFESSEINEAFWAHVKQVAPRGLFLPSRAASFDAVTKGHLAIGFEPNGFDYVPYLPSTAHEVRRFVEIGYGVSFSDPPQDLRSKGSLPLDAGREYWANLSTVQWTDIGKDLGIVGLVAPRDWKIALAPDVIGTNFNLYIIPEMSQPKSPDTMKR